MLQFMFISQVSAAFTTTSVLEKYTTFRGLNTHSVIKCLKLLIKTFDDGMSFNLSKRREIFYHCHGS